MYYISLLMIHATFIQLTILLLSRIKPPFDKFISIDLFQNLTAMANYLGQTMSPDREVRKGAEEFLRSVEGQQGYPILLLTLLNKENVDISIKIAASITFKNFIKRNWKVVSMYLVLMYFRFSTSANSSLAPSLL